MSELGNKPAFPRPFSLEDNLTMYSQEGMTLREHAAVEAMKGLLSNPRTFEGMEALEELFKSKAADIMAVSAINQADALIKALEDK